MPIDPAALDAARAIHKAGNLDEAERRYRALMAEDPNVAELNHLAGILAFNRGRLPEAEARVLRAIELNPNEAKYHGNLAAIYTAGRAHESALMAAENAVTLDPTDGGYRNTLGIVRRELGRTEEAIAAFRAAVALAPEDVEAMNNLAATLVFDGQVEEALTLARRAVARAPQMAETHNTLALALQRAGRIDEAIAALRHAIEIAPQTPEPYQNLGRMLEDRELLSEAEALYRKLVTLNPREATAYSSLGILLRKSGRTEDAVPFYRRATELRPDNPVYGSNFLFARLADPAADEAALLEEHVAWAVRHAAGIPRATAWANGPADPDRRLRVGFVSPDLRRHPVAYMLMPLIAALDPAAVEVYAYATRGPADELTERMQAMVPHWRDIAKLNDEAAETAIRADGIDILFDLAGHTAGHRLLLFARKPAPIQATWLGYATTTGLDAIDYVFGDAAMMPPGTDDRWSETVVRLPRTGFCIAPPEEAPPVGPLPAAARGGVITFGSLNNPSKITRAALDLWARVLAAVPGSRLLMQYRGLQDTGVVARMREAFAARNIQPDRVDFRGGAARAKFIAAYNEIDIGLDPFPYSGAMTTFEATWMGVPVVSMAGDRGAGRQSAAILRPAGLDELVCDDPAAYVAAAVRLASDPEGLARMRAGLRGRLAASPVCDGPAFARDVEAALRTVWRRWCAR
ncbi:MAG: tetratricopeptide repeat protein [Rhodospirillaceae bacterium]